MASRSSSSSADRFPLWTRALFEELLPVQAEPGVPVLLACDDETIRIVADRLGFDGDDPSSDFATDVRLFFNVGLRSGWGRVVAGEWARAAAPRPLPYFFSALCLWVLAASRMAPDDRFPTGEYHGRLCGLLDLSGDDSLPSFEFIGSRFQDLAQWLERDLEGKRGHLIVPTNPHPRHVGYAVAQTVFRQRDRQVLSRFFTERLSGGLDGFDPLRRLQRWSGRHALTQHATKLVEDPAFAEQVRAAIRSALHSWDRSELVEVDGGIGRVFPAFVRLLFDPTPKLQLGSTSEKLLELTIDGEQVTLAPRRELPLSWSLLERVRTRPVDLGDPRAATGALRLPRLGETLLFEEGAEGLLRSDRPAAETVWVLTRDGALQERLRQRRFSVADSLPQHWELFYEVPVDEIPGVERSLAVSVEAPLRLEGGLRLGHPRYLSPLPPRLVAGDLELAEQLPVFVNGARHGTIASGGVIELPVAPGRYDLVVGDGDFRASYDIEQCGEPQPVALCHQLEDERALRTGARPRPEGCDGFTVCGATVSPAYAGALPLLTRAMTDAETINTDGELVSHRRPPTQAWFKDVGLDTRSRWEIVTNDPVWLLLPAPNGGRPRVRLLVDREVAQLTPDAAARVVAIAESAGVTGGGISNELARERWTALVALARRVLGEAA